MKTVLGRTPPAGYSRYDPYTLEQIDTHPDAMRLWATLIWLQDIYEKEYEESYEDGILSANADHSSGYEQGYQEGVADTEAYCKRNNCF